MAEKSFGVEQLNVLGSGTPTISAPTTLNLDCHTVGVSTSLTVGANLSVSGISTIAQPADSNPIANWTITNNSNSAYRFTGPGQSGTDDDPNLYLVRGQRYIFKHNATASHPIQIRVSNGGAAYTDGITYSDPSNNVTTHGNNLIFNVQHDAPARLYYQCTSHGPMIGNIYIIGGPQVISGVVTATSFSGDLVGTIQTAAQTNITSLGTLSSTTINGNLTLSDSILHLGDLNTKMQFPSDDTISFTTNAVERVRIDSDGRLLSGATSSSSSVRGVFRGFAGDGGAGQGIIHLEVNKTTTNCGNGENLGSIRFGSNEGHIGALIGVQAESAWSGSGDLPSYINFKTCPDGSNTLGERLRINSLGQISIRGTNTAFDTTGDLDSLQLYYETDSGQASIGPYSSGGNTYLSFYTNSGGAAATEKVRILTGGYVNVLDGGITCTDTGAGSGTSNLELQPYGTDGYINCTASGNLYTRMGSGYAIRTRIDSSGNFHVNSGNIVMSTSGKGIDFSATGNGPSASSEVLDDYEEGTFTPTYDGTWTNISNSNLRQARYTRIGNTVHVWMEYYMSSNNGAIANNSNIRGFPFTGTSNPADLYPPANVALMYGPSTYLMDETAAGRAYITTYDDRLYFSMGSKSGIRHIWVQLTYPTNY